MITYVVAAVVLFAVIADNIRVRIQREDLREKLASLPKRGPNGKFEKRQS